MDMWLCREAEDWGLGPGWGVPLMRADLLPLTGGLLMGGAERAVGGVGGRLMAACTRLLG